MPYRTSVNVYNIWPVALFQPIEIIFCRPFSGSKSTTNPFSSESWNSLSAGPMANYLLSLSSSFPSFGFSSWIFFTSMYRKNSWLNDRFFPRWTFIGSMGRRRLLSGSRKCWRRERERKGKGRDREKVAIKRGKNIRRWNWEIYRVKRIETLTGSFLLDKIYFGSFFSLFFPPLSLFASFRGELIGVCTRYV